MTLELLVPINRGSGDSARIRVGSHLQQPQGI